MSIPTTCPTCGKRIVVTHTAPIGESRRRYYGCRSCGYRAGKTIIPLEYAPRRVATGSNQAS